MNATALSGKKIILAVAGSGGRNEYRDIELLPGTQPRDVLQKLGLHGFQIGRPNGGAFAMTDDLYGAVESGQKLFATKADVEAGMSPPGDGSRQAHPVGRGCNPRGWKQPWPT